MTDDQAPFGVLTPGVFPTVLTETHADDTTSPFWAAGRRDRLVAPRCTACGTFRLPPEPFCFACRTREVEWVDLPGTGTIYTCTVVRHPLHPDLAAACPYVTAVVELDGTQGAGARMILNVVDCDVDAVAIGDRVDIIWHHEPGISVPRARPLTPGVGTG